MTVHKTKMARNCEKKLVGLNRLWLEKQRKDELEKRPKRPHLSSLNSASEVKKWIPGIKREIDYCLDQISGARQHRYPDTKMKEFERKVEELEKEYKRFVKKVYELDPSTTGIPWQPRGYTSKRKNMESYSAETIPKKICTPLIDEEHHGRTSSPVNSSKSSVDVTDDTDSLQASHRDKGPDLKSGSDNAELIISKGADAKSGCSLNDMKLVQLKSLVGLEYDSSSDSDIS